MNCSWRHPSGTFGYSADNLYFGVDGFERFAEEHQRLQQGLRQEAALKDPGETAVLRLERKNNSLLATSIFVSICPRRWQRSMCLRSRLRFVRQQTKKESGAASSPNFARLSRQTEWRKVSAACCCLMFAAFASAGANHLHSIFATAFAAVCQRMPLQEPFGDPRPQAFFFPGFASSAR